MTEITPDTGTLEVKGSLANRTVTRAAETWQFFAFVFAALATFALTLLDEIPGRPWRIVTKIMAFVGLAYLTLVNVGARNWLATLLARFRQER
jgi:hypothetical protein